MACACQKNRKQFEVVTEAGKVVFTSTIRSTADNVAKRYPGSTVREKPKPGTATTGR
ncbi:hypothetical protein ACFRQM_09265 [Streptomyces sp. NPDC056831]|uniref:hypothetical protein n=1 Tax=Streptomyces sp. NPDC056831 TaxID=3345954 RepID=UPI0036BBD670